MYAENYKDIKSNAKLLWADAFKNDIPEAREIVRRGIHFVAIVDRGRIIFGPSRFVGHKNNSLDVHVAHRGSGTETNKRIKRIYGLPSRPNKGLEKELLSILGRRGLIAVNQVRRYWWDADVEGVLKRRSGRGLPLQSDDAVDYCALPGTDYLVTSKQRRHHDKFRLQLLKRWDRRCAVTNCRVQGILQAAHIKAWNASTPLERTDFFNGIPLTPTMHALFDRGLISFSPRGVLIISPLLSRADQAALGLRPGIRLRNYLPEHEEYMRHHRRRFKR